MTIDEILNPDANAPRVFQKRNRDNVGNTSMNDDKPTSSMSSSVPSQADIQKASTMTEEELDERLSKADGVDNSDTIPDDDFVKTPLPTWRNDLQRKETIVPKSSIADYVDKANMNKEEHDEQMQESRWERQRELARKDLLKALEEESKYLHRKTPEQMEKERRRERREQLFASIGDGISALSNLYFTTKGAPNGYVPERSMSEASRRRWDRLNKEREQDNDRYLQLQMQRVKMFDDALKDKREEAYRKQQLDYHIQKMEHEAKIAEARAKAYEQQGNRYAAQEEYDKARTLREDANRKLIEEKTKWVGETQQSVVDKNNASARASNARANKINNGGSSSSRGSGGGGKYVLNGKSYPSSAEYKKAVYTEANRLGIRTRGKSVDQLASEIEIKSANKPNPQPAKKAQSSSKPKATNQSQKKSLGLNWK